MLDPFPHEAVARFLWGWQEFYGEIAVITVEQVVLDMTVPTDEVRVVAMQPFIVFPDNAVEPYRWLADIVPRQLYNIQRTLDLARKVFSVDGAHFTLFPEYAVPGIQGAALIDNVVCSKNWPTGSVVIGGIDGLPKADYEKLCDSLSLQFAAGNAPACVEDGQWVNCCVVWAKDTQGAISKWVQPKIRPAWPELNVSCNDMFRGQTVYVYEARYAPTGYPCRFVTFICFDWVASVAGDTVCDELLSGLSQGLDDPLPIHWAFVIQHNPGPNHPSFLLSSYRFLTDSASYPFVERDKAVIIHANTAVAPVPVRNGNGAFSACILSPNAQVDCTGCRPTVCMQPSALRANPTLQKCYDVVFREMGECIHVFTVRVPKFISPNATDRTYPLPKAYVYPVAPSADARLPGGPVPASVKCVNDSLDKMPLPSKVALDGCPLKAQSMMAEKSVSTSLRNRDGHAARKIVQWATSSYSGGKKSRNDQRARNADMWDATEEDALKHVFFSLTALGLAYMLHCDGTALHAYIETGSGLIQVVAVRGGTHQDCREHLDDLVSEVPVDPVLLISRDDENLTPTPDEYLRIDEIWGKGGKAFQDYGTLIKTCRNATSGQELRSTLDGILPGHRRII